MKLRSQIPTRDNSTNFDIVSIAKTPDGTTLDNLKTAVVGEVETWAKYQAYAKAADEQGYPQVAKQFRATSAAEEVHFNMEVKLIQKEEPDYQLPDAPSYEAAKTDVNLVESALVEVYAGADMYPTFIQKAAEEGNTAAVQAFTRAKLADSVHGELYLQAYNDLDAPDSDDYYLCPICGYVHKGDDFERCPICFALKSAFKKF